MDDRIKIATSLILSAQISLVFLCTNAFIDITELYHEVNELLIVKVNRQYTLLIKATAKDG